MIKYSNPVHHDILGFEYGELTGKKIWDFQPTSGEKEALKEHFSRLIKEQPEPTPLLVKNQRKDGTVVDLQIDWNYDRGPDGTLNGLISVISDVSDSSEVDESLRQQTQGLTALLDVTRELAGTLELGHILQTTVDGITKLAGLDTGAIYLLEGEKLFLKATTPPLPPNFPYELAVAELADHPHIGNAISTRKPVYVYDFFNAELTQAEREVVEQRNLRTVLFIPLVVDEKILGSFIVGSNREPCHLTHIEIDLSHTLANLAALAVKNAQLYTEGREYASQLEKALTDRIRIDEEKNALQAQLLQAQKLDSLGRLAGGIAHDFNNLLVPIVGYVELSMKQLLPEDKLYSYLRHVKAAADRATGLTQQILAFSRKQVLEVKVIDLNRVVMGFNKMLKHLIPEDIEFQTFLDPDLPLISADQGQIEQVLLNLIVNARDAMEKGGQLTIETNAACPDLGPELAFFDSVEPGNFITLAVLDTGCGMNSETRKHIFDPFFTTKKKGEGTGLGLATVFGIVKQHGGYIWVSSEPGIGTSFYLLLPRAEETEVQEIPETNLESKIGSETILIVEDDKMVLDLVFQTLFEHGYKLIFAQSPLEALKLATEFPGPIHLLLTDVVMPEMDGRELYGKISALYPDIKLLYMSGYAGQVIGKHGVLEEGLNFLQKPFTIQSLTSKVRQVLN